MLTINYPDLLETEMVPPGPSDDARLPALSNTVEPNARAASAQPGGMFRVASPRSESFLDV